MTATDPASAKAPSHLSASSRRWYEAISGEFDLAPQHLRLLQAAAEAWDEKEAARTLLATDGLVIADRFGQSKPHPAAAIERDARLAFARLVRELMLDEEAPPDARPPRSA